MPKHAAVRGPKPPHSPHDKRQIMNRAPSQEWIRSWRDKIQVARLLTRLQTFANDDPDNPTGPRMTRTQATVALSLLRKVLPDMQALEVSGNSEKPLIVQVMRFSDGLIIDADHNPVAGGSQISDVAEELSAHDSAESRTNPSSSHVCNGACPYSGPSSDALPPAIERSPRLIEDEPPASARRTSRRHSMHGSERGRPVSTPERRCIGGPE
jgi:hypothetical protein